MVILRVGDFVIAVVLAGHAVSKNEVSLGDSSIDLILAKWRGYLKVFFRGLLHVTENNCLSRELGNEGGGVGTNVRGVLG